MKKDTSKKIMVFIVVLTFLGLTAVPVINAHTTKDNVEKIVNIIKIASSQINNNDDGSTYDLLIITPKEFVNELKPLACHKEKMGVSTKLVTLNQVYDQMYWHGRDKAEKIKYFIKQAIEDWGISYVLLIGGMKHQGPSWYFPVRYVYMDDGWENRYVTDLYYADIYDSYGNFSSWDLDNDGIYGEWAGNEADDKNIDLYPDVAVGRLPVRNKFEVKIMVNKIIHYEATAYGKPWFNDMLVIAGDTYPECNNPKWKGYEGELYAEEALSYMNGFNPTRLYTSDGTLTGPPDIIRAVSQGYGFLYFVGHGNPMRWSNHLPNSTKRIESFCLKHMLFFSNGDKLPICVVSGCHNCQFDVNIFKFLNKISRGRREFAPESWCWWMTRKIGGGSVATLGCTALGYTKEDKDSFEGGLNWIEVEFFRYYGVKNIDILGETWASAITSYIDTYSPIDWDAEVGGDSFIDVKVAQSWILFGDPSLKIGGYPLQLE